MSKTRLLLVVGVAIAAALTTALYVSRDGHDAARAQVPVIVAIDMDPTGNSCPGDGVTDCTLGAINSCVSVAAGAVVPFDVIVDNLPIHNDPDSDDGQGSIDFQLVWGASVSPAEPDVIDITARTEVSATVHYLQQAVGSGATLNDNQVLPRLLPPYVGSISDLGTSEENPPWTQGTGWRGALTVDALAAPGLYKLELDSNPLTYGVGNVVPYDECNTETAPGPGCTLQNGLVAVGLACPSLPTPTPSVTPTPTGTVSPTGTASPTPTPTGTVTPPSPGNTPLVTGWNDACYQGLSLAVSDAFASVIANVQAVYRMKPDQTFDRWFPTRPELSTITTLSPFDQLFILMSAGGVWTAQPLAPLTSSASLNPGWNSVCYLGGGKDTAAAVTGISGGFSIIYNLPPDQTWLRFVPGNPEVSNLARLETYTSVLVLMTEGGTWAFSP